MLEDVEEISDVFENISHTCTIILIYNVIMVVILFISSLCSKIGNNDAQV